MISPRAVLTSNTTVSASVQPYQQFLCQSAEGWGPLSPQFYDFTPCFRAVPSTGVALFGLGFGGFTIWQLQRQTRHPTPRNWHYYSKLVSIDVSQTCCADIAKPF